MEHLEDRNIYKIVRVNKKNTRHEYLSKLGKRWLPISTRHVVAKLTWKEADIFIKAKLQCHDAQIYHYYKQVV